MSTKSDCMDFTLTCLKQNSYQQFQDFIQNAPNSDVVNYCLGALQKFTEDIPEGHLKIVNLLQNLPLEKLDADAIKRVCAIVDDIVDRKPSLKHKALEVVKRIHQSSRNNKASHLKINSLLYRLAQKYPETKENIENMTHTPIAQLAPRTDKLPDLEYIFMGKEKSSAEKFKAIYNGTLPNKFSGGLWASPKTENGHSAWYNWSESVGETCWTTGANAYYIQPKDDCRCLVANSMDDLEPYFYNETCELIKFDVKALAKDYDCIYVSDENSSKFRYFWMVDSLVVLKADKFDAYTEEKWVAHKQMGEKIKNTGKTDEASPKKQSSKKNNIVDCKVITNNKQYF